MQVKSIAECSKGSILQYFRPSLKLPFVIKIFVLSIFEWPIYTFVDIHRQQICSNLLTNTFAADTFIFW